MTPHKLNMQLITNVCLGNNEAFDFLVKWGEYVHSIDDIVDEQTTNEFKIKSYIQALELYTHPFFLKYGATIKPIVYSVTNLYADSVKWEKTVGEKKEFSDWARHSAAEMLLTVAVIVGGYEHMRVLSEEIRLVHWSKEHNE